MKKITALMFTVAALAISTTAFGDPPKVETKTAPAAVSHTFSNGMNIAPSATTVTTGAPTQRNYSSNTSYGATLTIPLGGSGKK